MKSTLYVLIALFMLLASCSKDDDKVEPPYKIPLHDWNLTLEQVDEMMKADPTNPKGEIIMGPKKWLVTHCNIMDVYAIWKSDSLEYIFYPDNKLCAAKLKMEPSTYEANRKYLMDKLLKSSEDFNNNYGGAFISPSKELWKYSYDFWHYDALNVILENLILPVVEVTYANPKYIEKWDGDSPVHMLVDEEK